MNRFIFLLFFSAMLAGPVTARNLTDRTDDITGEQIRVLYVLPSDAADELLDDNGKISNSIKAAQAWFTSQTNGRRLRFDTFGGLLDIGFVRLNQTALQVRTHPNFLGTARDNIEDELISGGQIALNKKYAIYYGGLIDPSEDGCGQASGNGQTSAIWLKTTTLGCAPTGALFGASATTPNYFDYAIAHEIIHTLGFLFSTTPNHNTTSIGHTFDASSANPDSDLIYAQRTDQPDPGWNAFQNPVPADSVVIDVGRDDYFEHGLLNIRDLQRNDSVDNKVSHWRFDESSGAAVDTVTENGNSLTLAGGASYVAGRIANALSLNGTSGYATDTAPNFMNDTYEVSVTAWLKPTTNSGTGTVMFKGSTVSPRGYGMSLVNGSLAFIKNGTTNVVSTVPVPSGSYSHVAVAWSQVEQSVRFLLNGAVVQTISSPGNITPPITSDPIVVGRSINGTNYYNGEVDDLRVYSFRIFSSEVAQIISEASEASGGIKYSLAVRNAQLNTIEPRVGPRPMLRLCGGEIPVTVSAGDGGLAYLTMRLPDNWATTATSGFIDGVMAPTPWQGRIKFNTTSLQGITHYRIYDESGTVAHIQGAVSVTAGSGVVTLSSANIAAGSLIRVNAWSIASGKDVTPSPPAPNRVKYSLQINDDMLNALRPTIGPSAVLKLITGSVPPSVSLSDPGVTVATMQLNTEWLGTSSGGVISTLGTLLDSSADQTGIPTHARLFQSNGTTPHIQFDVTGTGGNGFIKLSSTNVIVGDTVSIPSLSINAPLQ